MLNDTARIDVHQHLWPPELIDALRGRSRPPRLDGWTLITTGEPPFEIDPAHHDPARRRELDDASVVLGLSSPLGIEDLDPADAATLLDAWHDGVRALAPDFRGYASVTAVEPDIDTLNTRLTDGFAGLQIPATWMASPSGVENLAGLLQTAADADKPVFVHPGRVRRTTADDRPQWWAAVVDYPTQLLAAWWSWHAVGRDIAPRLRICFAAGAGLAPVHHERYLARSGRSLVVDRDTFVDTSSYSRQGVDSLVRVLGVDPIVLGSDRPYGEAVSFRTIATDLGEAAHLAFSTVNPRRFLEGARP